MYIWVYLGWGIKYFILECENMMEFIMFIMIIVVVDYVDVLC